MTESKAIAGTEREAWREWAGTQLFICVCVCLRVCVCVRVCWVGPLFRSWCHAMFDKHSCPHWPYSCLQTLTLPTKRSCVSACAHTAALHEDTRVSVTLWVQQGPCVCLMKEISTLPVNAKAGWVCVGSNNRTLLLTADTSWNKSQSQREMCCEHAMATSFWETISW